MRISKILNQVQNKINIHNYEKQQKFINHYVNIENTTNNLPAMKEIYQAREILANYASNKGVRLDIVDSAQTAEKTSDKLLVKVTNILSGRKAEAEVAADTTAIYPKEKANKCLLHNSESGCEYQYTGKNYIEDNFLRNLYRNIEILTYKVNKNK